MDDDEVARMLEDLGVARRDQLSTSVDPRDAAPEDTRHQQAVRAAEAQRRANAHTLAGNDPQRAAFLTAWNTASTFEPDAGAEHLTNRCDGQGHRAAISNSRGRPQDDANEAAQARYGEERLRYMRDHNIQRAPRAPQSSSGDRGRDRAAPNPNRAPSPRAQGVKRYINGKWISVDKNGNPIPDSTQGAPTQPSTMVTPTGPSAISSSSHNRTTTSTAIPASSSSSAVATSSPAPGSMGTRLRTRTNFINEGLEAAGYTLVGDPENPATSSRSSARAGRTLGSSQVSQPRQPIRRRRVDASGDPTANQPRPVITASHPHPLVDPVTAGTRETADRIRAMYYAANPGQESDSYHERHPHLVALRDRARAKLVKDLTMLAADPSSESARDYIVARDCAWMMEIARKARELAQRGASGDIRAYLIAHPDHRDFVDAAMNSHREVEGEEHRVATANTAALPPSTTSQQQSSPPSTATSSSVTAVPSSTNAHQATSPLMTAPTSNATSIPTSTTSHQAASPPSSTDPISSVGVEPPSSHPATSPPSSTAPIPSAALSSAETLVEASSTIGSPTIDTLLDAFHLSDRPLAGTAVDSASTTIAPAVNTDAVGASEEISTPLAETTTATSTSLLPAIEFGNTAPSHFGVRNVSNNTAFTSYRSTSNATHSTTNSESQHSVSTEMSEPPRRIAGILTTMFFNSAGGLEATRSTTVSPPVHISINVTSRRGDFDPRELADRFDKLASQMRDAARAADPLLSSTAEIVHDHADPALYEEYLRVIDDNLERELGRTSGQQAGTQVAQSTPTLVNRAERYVGQAARGLMRELGGALRSNPATQIASNPMRRQCRPAASPPPGSSSPREMPMAEQGVADDQSHGLEGVKFTADGLWEVED